MFQTVFSDPFCSKKFGLIKLYCWFCIALYRAQMKAQAIRIGIIIFKSRSGVTHFKTRDSGHSFVSQSKGQKNFSNYNWQIGTDLRLELKIQFFWLLAGCYSLWHEKRFDIKKGIRLQSFVVLTYSPIALSLILWFLVACHIIFHTNEHLIHPESQKTAIFEFRCGSL